MTETAELPLSTSDIKQEVKVRMGPGQAGIPPLTVMEAFDRAVARFGDEYALHQQRSIKGEPLDEAPWKKWTWNQYKDQVRAFGKALIAIGFERFDAINIIGFNSPEWFFANFGAIAAGGVAAGVYATNGPDACKYIAEHSKARVVVVDGLKQLEKYYDIANNLPNLKCLVMYGTDQLPSNIRIKCPVPVHTYEKFLALGIGVTREQVADRASLWKPGETCQLVYTSGTTGPPKSVMITNDNVTWTAQTMLKMSRKGYLDTLDSIVSYLPLSHIAAQVLDLYQPLFSGCKVHFARPDALKGSLVETLKAVRPTIFFGVPRVWEKMYDKMQEVAKTITGVKKLVSAWAKEETGAYWDSQSFDGRKEFSFTRELPIPYYAAQTLLAAVHEKLGLDRCLEFYVAAAPIDLKILKYFHSIDIPILEVFGQSECTGPHLSNQYSAFKLGTVGRPMLGTVTKIDKSTGELCYSGRNVFAGYLNMEDKTKETIDADGFVHTGDIAKVDRDRDPRIPGESGFYTITGRIKELIITAGGENVPPVLIEAELRLAMPALANAMVIGDKRKFLTVLLCLHVEVDGDGNPTDRLSGVSKDIGETIGSSAKTTAEVRVDAQWKEYFDRGMKTANAKATSQAQRVGKWAVVDTGFSEKGGELTPTLKLKRNVTAEKYRAMIEAMYA